MKKYIYYKNIEVNEGLTTGQLSKNDLLITNKFIFLIKQNSIGMVGRIGTISTTINYDDFNKELDSMINNASISDIEKKVFEFVGEEGTYEINNLESIKIQIGFWIIGGLWFKKQGENKKAINLQPKSRRKELKVFLGI